MRACLLFAAAVFGLLSGSVWSEVIRYQLRDEQEASSEASRERLKYLVDCALPEGVAVSVSHNGTVYQFDGAMGLAPGWLTRGLTVEEQQLLTTCLLARTNFFGKRVLLSLRANDDVTAPAALQVSAQEALDNPYFEAAFFGNIFIDNPQLFVCAGPDAGAREKKLEAMRRVCSLPAPAEAGGPGHSRCSFLLVGVCSANTYKQNGIDYTRQALKVYLPDPDLAAAEFTGAAAAGAQTHH
ncbi:hypothetical protein HPT27_06030 [Permianibacter sp. IMCC34836]|uniref:hypothetical protein n=1 Tax=Permianibacter fluminis TaxID=2738515 RepID=UPI001552F4C0|nr:hypothetical protein [Permianibacter fluminis]NQD36575.1 hypothetical protein [Permianibacter fluminis]